MHRYLYIVDMSYIDILLFSARSTKADEFASCLTQQIFRSVVQICCFLNLLWQFPLEWPRLAWLFLPFWRFRGISHRLHQRHRSRFRLWQKIMSTTRDFKNKNKSFVSLNHQWINWWFLWIWLTYIINWSGFVFRNRFFCFMRIIIVKTKKPGWKWICHCQTRSRWSLITAEKSDADLQPVLEPQMTWARFSCGVSLKRFEKYSRYSSFPPWKPANTPKKGKFGRYLVAF